MWYCFFVNKNVQNFILSLIILVVVFVILIPYFSSYLLELKQIENNKTVYKKLLKEQEENTERIYLTGKFDPAQRRDFVLIPPQYVYGGNNMYLRKETLNAFTQMQDIAAMDGINLKIASATRNFEYQKGLWEKKWNGITFVDGKALPESIPDGLERFKKILEYSAAPATSRHHWGTDIDINGADPAYFNSEKGRKEYEWLVQNADKFGFCQIYNQKGQNRATGYNEEKWHWSYLPIARDLTQEYARLVTKKNISGFAGDNFINQIDLMNDYVLSINSNCI